MSDINNPDFYQKAIARKVGNTFRLAAEEGYAPLAFCDYWLHSDVARRLWDENPRDVAEWALYQLESLRLELSENGKQLPTGKGEPFPEEMYWLGYLLTYWGFAEEISGPELAEKYEMDWILSQYDTLHTVSIEYAIETIKAYFEYERE